MDSLSRLSEVKEFLSSEEAALLIGATWCQPCKQFKPHFEKASGSFDFPFAYVYMDEMDIPESEAVEYFGINSVPTVLYYHQGVPVDLKQRRVLAFIDEVNSKRHG